jgi:hypothetical protein
MVCVKTSTHMLNWENARFNCVVTLLFFSLLQWSSRGLLFSKDSYGKNIQQNQY